MAKSKKCGLNLRRKNALTRLEAFYKGFKERKEDKPLEIVDGKVTKVRKYADECSRIAKEIEILKKRIK